MTLINTNQITIYQADLLVEGSQKVKSCGQLNQAKLAYGTQAKSIITFQINSQTGLNLNGSYLVVQPNNNPSEINEITTFYAQSNATEVVNQIPANGTVYANLVTIGCCQNYANPYTAMVSLRNATGTVIPPQSVTANYQAMIDCSYASQGFDDIEQAENELGF